jgi:RNA polymerase-binding protein DksA
MARKKKTSRNNDRRNKRVASELALMERKLLDTLQQRLAKARCMSTHDPTEFLDIASESELDEAATRLAESASAKIEEIEEALRLLREGNYGTCQNCGKKISTRRLKARPFSILCLHCKQKAERQYANQSEARSMSSGTAPPADLGLGEYEEESPSYEDLFRDAEATDLY